MIDYNWILTKEKLPEEDKRYKNKKIVQVLVTTKNGKVTKVQRRKLKDYWTKEYTDCWNWDRIREEPIAWMPLPEPYKIKKENN